MPNEGDKKELDCIKCQKVTMHVFEVVGMVPEITLQWCCKACGTVIIEEEVKMKAGQRTFLKYLHQYASVSAKESIHTSLKVIADAFNVPLWTAGKIMRHLKKDGLVNEFRGPGTLFGDERFEITRKGIRFLDSEPT